MVGGGFWAASSVTYSAQGVSDLPVPGGKSVFTTIGVSSPLCVFRPETLFSGIQALMRA